MIGGMTNEFLFTMPAGGGQVNVDLRPLNPTAHNMPLHIYRINFRLKLLVTPHATNDEEGENLVNVIDRVEVRDILNNVIVNLRGRHIDHFIKCCRGSRYDTPADVAGGGEQAYVYWYGSIPFHGGPGGIAGMREPLDAVLPVERIREQVMTVYFNATALAEATLDAAYLYVSFDTFPYKELIVGSDVRYSYFDHANAQRIELSTTGKAVLCAAICQGDFDHSDVTAVTSEQFAFMSNVQADQLLQRWNWAVADSPDQYEDPNVGAFLPLIMQDRRTGVQGGIGYPGQKAIFDVTNTIGETIELCSLQVHNTKRLADRLMNKRGTIFEQMNFKKPKFEKKNAAGVASGNPALAQRIGCLLAQKLVRGA